MDSCEAVQTVLTTPDTMATISLPTDTFYQAWTEHKTNMNATRMERYSNILYDRLAMIFQNSQEAINHTMLKAIRESKRNSDLTIPLYSYRARVFDEETPQPERTRLDRLCVDEGWHWTAQIEGDRYPVSHYAVIRYTNLCQRLSLLFGGNNYWVSWRFVRPVKSQPYMVVSEYELTLQYFPDGLPEARRAALDRVKPSTLPPNTAPISWTEHFPWVERPRAPAPVYATPPRPVRFAPPPPPELLRHRRAAGGGDVREYDSFEEAARDLMRECYCQQCTDDESEAEL